VINPLAATGEYLQLGSLEFEGFVKNENLLNCFLELLTGFGGSLHCLLLLFIFVFPLLLDLLLLHLVLRLLRLHPTMIIDMHNHFSLALLVSLKQVFQLTIEGIRKICEFDTQCSASLLVVVLLVQWV